MSNAKQKNPEKVVLDKCKINVIPSHYNLYIVSHSIVMTKMKSL